MATYITAYGKQEMAKLESEYNDLNVTKYKLDSFFDLFLDKYDTKLRGDRKKDDPFWKLYDEKYAEYERVTQKLAFLKHKLKKG